MKDAKGHGSDPKGATSAHAEGVDQIGREPKMVPINSIRPYYDIFQGNNQQRVVDKLRAAIRSGASLPPLDVTPSGRIKDGNHRYEAFKQEGFKYIRVRGVS